MEDNGATNIVILGAGTVGTSIAELLCESGRNVTLIDSSREALERLEERLDVQTICGSGCDAITLFQAGVQSAELCLAVTSHDEVNLVGASLARTMGAGRCVARVYSESYLDFSTFDYARHFSIDRLVSLEYLTALELSKGIRSPGLSAVESFARGGVIVQELVVTDRAKVVGTPLKDLKLPAEVRVGLISDGTRTRIAGADDVVNGGDRIVLIGKQEKIEDVARIFAKKGLSKLNVTIAGGGEIGLNLARLLEGRHFNVTLLESDPERCELLSRRLTEATVLHTDITRRSEMEEARVHYSDLFVAATGRDEDNIVCGVEARELGAGQIFCIVRRPDYVNVLAKMGIDFAVSPRDVLARELLGMVEGGPIIARSDLSGGEAEVWEVEVHEGTPITAGPLKDLKLPRCLLAAVIKDGFVRVPGADDHVKPGSTVVVMLEKQNHAETLALFTNAD